MAIKTAMILAAGRGERMRPLTDTCPKPMLKIAGKPLIEYHIERLIRAGVDHVVINLCWLGEQIKTYLGTGAHLGIKIEYSEEEQALETGGGIQKALPLLGNDPFWLVNGDVWTDYPFARAELDKSLGMYLIMVPNPEHNKKGDFALKDGKLLDAGQQRLTYSGIGIFDPVLFQSSRNERFPLVEIIREQIALGSCGGEKYAGCWSDVGTPERLLAINVALQK